MNPKITVLLGIFLVGLVGFVFFYEQPRMEAERHTQDAEKEFLDVSRHTVAKLTINNKFGHFVAEKQGNNWQILEPVNTPADWPQFEDMVTIAREVERGRVIVGPDAYAQTDLSAFGLAPPQVELRFEGVDGEDIWLFFGDDNPAGRAAYLSWSGSDRVVLTQRHFRNRFNLQLIDLRDKQVLPFDLDSVQKMVLEHSDKTFELVRNGFTWQIIQPEKYVGDGAEINNILGTVQAERIVDVVDESLQDSVRYGFDRPGYRFELTYKDGQKRSLILGKQVEDQRTRVWYASNSERQYVFTVEPFVTDFLSIELGDIRNKRVFEFDRAGIDKIQLEFPHSTVSCVLDAGKWVVKEPAGFVVGENAVGTWIDKVHTMAVSDFAGKVNDTATFGQIQPALHASLWRNNELVREVKIWQGADGWYGSKNGSDEVFAFESGVMSGLRLGLVKTTDLGIQVGAQ